MHLTTLTFRGGRREKLVLDAPYGLPVNGSHPADGGSEYLPPADGKNRTGNAISPIAFRSRESREPTGRRTGPAAEEFGAFGREPMIVLAHGYGAHIAGTWTNDC